MKVHNKHGIVQPTTLVVVSVYGSYENKFSPTRREDDFAIVFIFKCIFMIVVQGIPAI
jgi:hypothetical protein